jgi:uncharacterized protein YqcC (DUF446 family)
MGSKTWLLRVLRPACPCSNTCLSWVPTPASNELHHLPVMSSNTWLSWVPTPGCHEFQHLAEMSSNICLSWVPKPACYEFYHLPVMSSKTWLSWVPTPACHEVQVKISANRKSWADEQTHKYSQGKLPRILWQHHTVLKIEDYTLTKFCLINIYI